MREQAVEVRAATEAAGRGRRRWPAGWREAAAASWRDQGADPAAVARRPARCTCATPAPTRRCRCRSADASTQVAGAFDRRPPRRASASPRPAAPLMVEAVAVEATAAGERRARTAAIAGAPRPARRRRSTTVRMWQRRRRRTRRRCSSATRCCAGDRIDGPALIREANATTVVEPGWQRRGDRRATT